MSHPPGPWTCGACRNPYADAGDVETFVPGSAPAPSAPSPYGSLLIVGALALGGYFLATAAAKDMAVDRAYRASRHFKAGRPRRFDHWTAQQFRDDAAEERAMGLR